MAGGSAPGIARPARARDRRAERDAASSGAGGRPDRNAPGVELPVRLADGRYELFIAGATSVSLGRLEVRGRARSYSVRPSHTAVKSDWAKTLSYWGTK